MKIDEFINIDNPEKFDLSSEFSTEDYKESSACEKYVIYKAYTTANRWSDAFDSGREFRKLIRDKYIKKHKRKIINWINDPDNGSELLTEIYDRLWPFMYDEKKGRFWSDTLSSVQYTMADIFEVLIETRESRNYRYSMPHKQNCSIQYIIDYLSKITTEGKVEDRVKSAAAEIEKVKGVDLFLSAWHTLGNYCPVPEGFNAPRSNFGKYDFWDFTLTIIRKWYLLENVFAKEKLITEDLFHFNKKGNVEECTRWLSQFGDGENGWEKFVDTFFFQDWVYCEVDKVNTYYDVVPLSPSHIYDNALTPFNDLELFFTNYRNRIYRRGKRILDAVVRNDN